MNDIDEFLEVAASMFVAITALLIWLTYLEAGLLRPARRRCRRWRFWRGRRLPIDGERSPDRPLRNLGE